MKIHNLKIGIALLLIATIFNACTDDESADPNVPGSDRDKFVGEWLCKETIPGNPPNTFTINIEKHGNDDTVFVYNFNNLGAGNYAIWLISDNSVTIPLQAITQTDVSGSGFFNSEKISLSYSSDSDQATANCTRQ